MQGMIFVIFPVNFVIWLGWFVYVIGAHICIVVTRASVKDMKVIKYACLIRVL